MKKRIMTAAVLAGVLAMTMPFTVFAQNANNVWVNEMDIEYDEGEWIVEIKSDGKTTDGLLVLTYDEALLSVEETDVFLTDDVEMYSVNAESPGLLKIAYLSEDTVAEGILAEIVFTALSEEAAFDALDLTGDVHDMGGNVLNVGKCTMNPESGKDSEEENPNTLPDDKNSIGTGDDANILLYAVGCGAGLVICGAILFYKIKNRRG